MLKFLPRNNYGAAKRTLEPVFIQGEAKEIVTKVTSHLHHNKLRTPPFSPNISPLSEDKSLNSASERTRPPY